MNHKNYVQSLQNIKINHHFFIKSLQCSPSRFSAPSKDEAFSCSFCTMSKILSCWWIGRCSKNSSLLCPYRPPWSRTFLPCPSKAPSAVHLPALHLSASIHSVSCFLLFHHAILHQAHTMHHSFWVFIRAWFQRACRRYPCRCGSCLTKGFGLTKNVYRNEAMALMKSVVCTLFFLFWKSLMPLWLFGFICIQTQSNFQV